ncbi:MAG TPA: ferredoxin [Candidatus Lokiarchaeia archaeon]|nr:ferredoxin [Candidatus Lokiarchaeia archaeon]
MTYEVRQEHEDCTGCELCVTLCPDHWTMADDGKSRVVGALPLEDNQGWEHATFEDEGLECDKEAEARCPVSVIHVIE